MNRKVNIGDKVIIINKESWAYDEWGIVILIADNLYHISMANNENIALVFFRNELKLK